MRGQPADRSVARVFDWCGARRAFAERIPVGPIDWPRPAEPNVHRVFSGWPLASSSAPSVKGASSLYLRRLDQLEASPIAGTVGASNPFFSPDGQSLGFHADGASEEGPLAGGPVVVLCNVDLVYGASWGRMSQIVFARQTGGLWQVSAAGGTPTAVNNVARRFGRAESPVASVSARRADRALYGDENRIPVVGRHADRGAVAHHRKPEGARRGRRRCAIRRHGASGLSSTGHADGGAFRSAATRR